MPTAEDRARARPPPVQLASVLRAAYAVQPPAHRVAPRHRRPSSANVPIPALLLESQRTAALILARTAARAAAGERTRALIQEQRHEERTRRRPASAPIRVRKHPMPKAKLAAARAAAAKLLDGSKKQRSPWGFFLCDVCDDAEGKQRLLHVSAPAAAAWDDLDDAPTPDFPLPDVTVARPAMAEERRLAFGPFAFRLSPSSEVLAWLAATILRPVLRGAHVLELGSGLGFTGLAVAKWCECASVRLTDGDPASVALLERVVETNRRCSDALGDAMVHGGGFGATTVDAAMLLWGEHAPPPVPLSPAASGGDGLDERSTYDVRVATLVALPRLRCKRLSRVRGLGLAPPAGRAVRRLRVRPSAPHGPSGNASQVHQACDGRGSRGSIAAVRLVARLRDGGARRVLRRELGRSLRRHDA